MSNLVFTAVDSEQYIVETSKLADIIWHEHYESLLSKEQIDYMVDKFQSVAAMTEQINRKGYEYFLLQIDKSSVGFIGIQREKESLFLSKIYVKKEQRGKGYASKAMEFLETYCLNNGLKKIWLTVNRYNESSIQVYRKKGFVATRTQVTDIGSGFVMDDYIMEKTVS